MSRHSSRRSSVAVVQPEEIVEGILDEEIVIALPEEVKIEVEKVVFAEIEETEEEVEEEEKMKASDFL